MPEAYFQAAFPHSKTNLLTSSFDVYQKLVASASASADSEKAVQYYILEY